MQGCFVCGNSMMQETIYGYQYRANTFKGLVKKVIPAFWMQNKKLEMLFI